MTAAQVFPLVAARGLDRILDYAVPPQLEGAAQPGALVVCPLGPRRVLGVVVGRDAATHEGRLAPLAGVVDVPPVPAELLDLAGWMARYYLAPVAACMKLVLPPGGGGALRRGDDGGWVLAPPPGRGAERLVARLSGMSVDGLTPRRREVMTALEAAGGTLAAATLCREAGTTMATLRALAEAGAITLAGERSGPGDALTAAGGAAPRADTPPPLTGPQGEAVAEIERLMDGEAARSLVHGVTGSGKTEVYLRAIASARARGRGSLVLVPEIALTPQLLSRLRARLGEDIAIWHSALTPAQRAAEHRRVREGRADVVLGARSAVFAPVVNLGLVVVDEEHDGSYKQDASPRYDARQVAARRARPAGAAVVYGSATPARRRGTRCRAARCPSAPTARRCPRSRSWTCAPRAPGPCRARSPRRCTRRPGAARRPCCWRAGAGSR